MALCPHCHHALPDSPAGLCPNCGGDPRPPPGRRPCPRARRRRRAARGPPPARPSSGTGAAARPRIPWDERDRIGVVSALVETTREVLTQPGAFFRAMPVTGGLGSPLLYAVIIGWIGLVASAFYQAIFRSVVGSGLGCVRVRPAGDRGPAGLGRGLGRLRGAGRLRGRLRGDRRLRRGRDPPPRADAAGRGAPRLRGDVPRGAASPRPRASSSSSPSAASSSAGIWTLVLYVLGLAEAHQIGHGKAAAAVLLPIVLVCCCCAGARLPLRGSDRRARRARCSDDADRGRAGGRLPLVARSSAPPLGAIFGGIGLLAAAAVGLLRLDRIPLTLCVFKGLTGLPCPTCGSTRALGRLFALDFAGALAMNPLHDARGGARRRSGRWPTSRSCPAGVPSTSRSRSRSGSPCAWRLLVLFLANWVYLIAVGR